MAIKAEKDFINEYTRSLLVEWSVNTIYGINPAIPQVLPSASGTTVISWEELKEDPFIAHALDKGWIAKDGSRVLAKGLTVAKGFLKR